MASGCSITEYRFPIFIALITIVVQSFNLLTTETKLVLNKIYHLNYDAFTLFKKAITVIIEKTE